MKVNKEKKPTNDISSFLLKKMIELRPDDNINKLSIRTGIPRNTLWNRFYKSKEWDQAILLMVICGDLGITMEEALVGSKIPEAKSELLNSLQTQIRDLSIELDNLKSENKILTKKLNNIKKSLQ